MQMNKQEMKNLRLQFENFKFKEEQSDCLIYFPWGLTNNQTNFSIAITVKPDQEHKIVVTDQATTIESLGKMLLGKKQAVMSKVTEIAHYYHLKAKEKDNDLYVYQDARHWNDLSEILKNFYTYGIAVKELLQTIPVK